MDFLKHAPKYLRAPIARGLRGQRRSSVTSRVIRDGGDTGAGLIKSFSVVTRGEAIGHDMFLDGEFLQQTADRINAAGHQGIKSRFTHPGLSGDGLGRFLGRVKNGRVSGDQVFGDLHLSRLAHNTPDGDLAEFVMGMAADEPDMFGTSIVFSRDEAAEARFAAENQDRRGRFVSPDRKNVQEFPHARLGELRANDVVDDPAANPAGMFSRGDGVVKEADALLSYALGLNDEVPELVALELDPERVAAYLRRFLAANGLQILPSLAWTAPSTFTPIEDSTRTVILPENNGERSSVAVLQARIRSMLSSDHKAKIQRAVDRLAGEDQERLDAFSYGTD